MGSEFDRGIDVTASSPGEYVAELSQDGVPEDGPLMECFDLGRPGWAPTLELTAHVRANPAPGWLKISHQTRNIAGGMFEEECEVWDSAGRLVGQSRQLARMPR